MRCDWKYKMVGVVTLYQPDMEKCIDNIEKYIADIDTLIIWDNSPLSLGLQERISKHFCGREKQIIWHGNGENTFIAPAIDYALEYAQKKDYDLILTMDQDSVWDDFRSYRKAIELDLSEGYMRVYTPYIKGCDKWKVTKDIQNRHLFINSGTVYPTEILVTIGGTDPMFPLDALDHDLSIRVQKAGFDIVCLTNCLLYHSMGTPTKSKYLPLKANNYNAQRTYEITRCHIINYRKHRDWLNYADKFRIIKDFVVMRIIRILLLETDKWFRIKMIFKGIKDGFSLKIQ